MNAAHIFHCPICSNGQLQMLSGHVSVSVLFTVSPQHESIWINGSMNPSRWLDELCFFMVDWPYRTLECKFSMFNDVAAKTRLFFVFFSVLWSSHTPLPWAEHVPEELSRLCWRLGCSRATIAWTWMGKNKACQLKWDKINDQTCMTWTNSN